MILVYFPFILEPTIFILYVYSYVMQHYKQNLNQTPNYNYLGHPINAYHFIRHVVYGWEYVSRHLPELMAKKPLPRALGKYLVSKIFHVFLHVRNIKKRF